MLGMWVYRLSEPSTKKTDPDTSQLLYATEFQRFIISKHRGRDTAAGLGLDLPKTAKVQVFLFGEVKFEELMEGSSD